MDLREIELGVWIKFIWLRIKTSGKLFLNTVMNLQVP
jgi:hypothetical protein